jgi:hypothetical protein
VGTGRFPRPNYEDWERALHRAYAGNVELLPHPTSAAVMLATSATVPGARYVVNEFGCNCAHGKQVRAEKRGICKHRALYLMRHATRLGGTVIDPFAVPVGDAVEEVA